MKGKEEYEQVLKIAELGNLTPQEMNEYQQSLKIERDNYSALSSAKNEGIAEGKAEGIEIGEHNKALETASKLILKGFPTDEISELTGLSVEEIEALR